MALEFFNLSGHYATCSLAFGMSTPAHLTRQPRSRRAQRRRRRRYVLLAVVLGLALAGGAYLVG